MTVVTDERTEYLLPLLNNASFKGAVSMSESNLFYFVMWSNGKILERLLPERLFLEMFSMGFPRNHHFFEVFKEKLDQMLSGGLIDYYTSRYKDYINPKRYAHLTDKSSEVIKMSRFESGFVIWFVSTSFALIGFSLEWFLKLKEFLVLRHMIEAFRNRVVESFNQNAQKRIAKKARLLNVVREKTIQQLSFKEANLLSQGAVISAVDEDDKKVN